MNKLEEYLINQIPFPIKCYDNNKCALIIEPRPHKLLLGIIYQVIRNLGDWNLIIVGSDLNQKLIDDNLSGKYTFINCGINNFDKHTYSMYLRSIDLWERIPYNNILVFQTDSFIIGSWTDKFLQFPYIGAIYNYGFYQNNKFNDIVSHNGQYGINGGFSFRKRNCMLNCIKNVNINDIMNWRRDNGLNTIFFEQTHIIPEDVYFANALAVLGYTLPDHTICNRFCSQMNLIENSFGIHAFNKGFITKEIKELLEKERL